MCIFIILGYIGTVDKGFLVPGSIGMGLYEGYVAMDLALAKPNLRAEFENDLKQICASTKDFKQVLQEQILKYKEAYKIMENRVISLDEKMGARLCEIPRVNQNIQVATQFSEVFKCPKCKIANMALKRTASTNFPYITCLNFPECKNSVWFSKDVVKDVALSEKKCRRCGDDIPQLKIMFTNMYYKLLFNVPTGWYETCLRCDIKLRNTLGINLDQIKSVGRIIEISTTSTTETQSISNALSLQNHSTNNLTKRRNCKPNQGSKQKKSDPSKSNNVRSISTYLRDHSHTTPVNTSFATEFVEELNDIFSDEDADMIAAVEAVDRVNTNSRLNVETIDPVSTLPNDDLNNMFDDDFDEFDFSRQSNNGRSMTEHCNYEELFDDDNVFECFIASDGDRSNETQHSTIPNNNFTSNRNENVYKPPCENEELAWGTRNASTYTNQNINFASSNSQQVQDTPCNAEDVWGTRSLKPNLVQNKEQNTPYDSNDIVWGTRNTRICLTAGTSTSNQSSSAIENSWGCSSNQKLETNKENTRAIMEWTEERNKIRKQNAINRRSGNLISNQNNRNSEDTSNNFEKPKMNCSKCGAILNILTVRKEGLNTGRQFFSCRTSCNFFKWADEISTDSCKLIFVVVLCNFVFKFLFHVAITRTTNTTAAAAPPKPRAPKKCGLCRQEGHTKLKCPSKDQLSN